MSVHVGVWLAGPVAGWDRLTPLLHVAANALLGRCESHSTHLCACGIVPHLCQSDLYWLLTSLFYNAGVEEQVYLNKKVNFVCEKLLCLFVGVYMNSIARDYCNFVGFSLYIDHLV